MKSYVLLFFILYVVPVFPKIVYMVVCFHPCDPCLDCNQILIIGWTLVILVMTIIKILVIG